MNMKKITFAVLLCILFCVSAFSQEAKKIDEFEITTCDDYWTRMGKFFGEIANEPNADGYILIYEGKLKKYKNGKTYYVLPHFGEAKSYKKSITNRMQFIRFDTNRLIFVDAGFREKMTVEFWLVIKEKEAPKPTPTLKKIKYQKGKTVDFCAGDIV